MKQRQEVGTELDGHDWKKCASQLQKKEQRTDKHGRETSKPHSITSKRI